MDGLARCGAGTAPSESDFHALKNITKQTAPMTNVTTLKTSFMGDTDQFLLRGTSMDSTVQPLGFARAARHKHRPEGAGGLRKDTLVGHALIGAQWRLRRKQIWRDISVLVG
jgi:hypothetical protein